MAISKMTVGEFRKYRDKSVAEYAAEHVKAGVGLQSIRLHVFGHNRIARGLYKKIGYEETNVFMEKWLNNQD